MARSTKRAGFTIVELLIVVVVIAILAAITIVAYNGIQQTARDSIRKNDIANVAKALHLYNVKKNDLFIDTNTCGRMGTGEGWLSHRSSLGGATSYARSVTDCLKDDGFIQQDIIDPSGCTDNVRMAKCDIPTTAYMKVNCTSGGSEYVYLIARLEGETNPKPADLDSTNCPYDYWYDMYGMTYAVRVE